jgi:hypothetical protein
LNQLLLNSNQFAGTISSSIQQLLQLSQLDLSSNQFSGQLDLFATSFAPSIVNLSHNALSGKVGDFVQMKRARQLALIDIQHNAFDCPYPINFPKQTVLLRSECVPPYMEYLKTLGYIALAAGGLGALLFVASKCMEEVSMAATMYLVDWLFDSIALVLDAFTYRDIVNYITSVDNQCSAMNQYYVFSLFMTYLHPELVSADSVLFSNWIQSAKSIFTSAEISSNTADISKKCGYISSCGFDFAQNSCILVDPSKAATGIDAFPRFYGVIIAVIAVRCLVEAARLIVLLLSFRQPTAVYGRRRGSDFIRSFALTPLLYFHFPDVFSRSIVQHRPKFTDFFRRLVHTGLMIKFPMLAINVYFLNNVTQTGLSVTNVLSLIGSIVYVPRLLAMSFRAYQRFLTEQEPTKTSDGMQQFEDEDDDNDDVPKPASNSTSTEKAAPTESMEVELHVK